MGLSSQKIVFFFKKKSVLQIELQLHELNLSLHTKYKTGASP